MLLWDILCVSVDTSTRTPYCSTVCLCLNNSLTHSLTPQREAHFCNAVSTQLKGLSKQNTND